MEIVYFPYIPTLIINLVFHVFHTFEKKIHFMGVFDPSFHTFAPKFRKIDKKTFCKCHFMRFFKNFSTLLVCKKCGNFMILPHFCHNMCQYVSTTPISTLETRCHLLETSERNYQGYTSKLPLARSSFHKLGHEP